MIQNEQELEVTRQRIAAFQDALLALRRNQSTSNYKQIAKNFLYEIKKMEEEVHEYLQRLPNLNTSLLRNPHCLPHEWMMSPMKTPVYLALLVAMALVCAPRAAVLAKEATVVQPDSTVPMRTPCPLRTPLGRVCYTSRVCST